MISPLDLFSECYSNSEDRAYVLLVRKTHCWSKSTVLTLATEADAKCFFAHDGVQVTTRLRPESARGYITVDENYKTNTNSTLYSQTCPSMCVVSEVTDSPLLEMNGTCKPRLKGVCPMPQQLPI